MSLTDTALKSVRARMVTPLRRVIADHVLAALAAEVFADARAQAPGNAPVSEDAVIALDRALSAPYGTMLAQLVAGWQAADYPAHAVRRDLLGPAADRIAERGGLAAGEAIGTALRICHVLRALADRPDVSGIVLAPAPGYALGAEAESVLAALRDRGIPIADTAASSALVLLRLGRGRDRPADLLRQVVRLVMDEPHQQIVLFDPAPKHLPDPVAATGLATLVRSTDALLACLARPDY